MKLSDADCKMRQCFQSLVKKIRDTCPEPEVLFVDTDRGSSGSFARDAGLLLAIDHVGAALAASHTPPAILLMGVLETAQLQARASTIPGALRVLDWPGISYLRYVFDQAELTAAAKAALAGREEPFPSADRDELCAQLADVQHWLERFRLNAIGAQAIVADVAKGTLPATALASQQWLSEKHLTSLNRLIAALKLSEHASAGARLAQAKDAFQSAAFTYEEHKAQAFERQRIAPVRLPSLSLAATRLVTSATEITSEVSRLDSKIRKLNLANEGPAFDEDSHH